MCVVRTSTTPTSNDAHGICVPNATTTTVPSISRETKLAVAKCITAVGSSVSDKSYIAACGDAIDQAKVDGDQNLVALVQEGNGLATSMAITMALSGSMPKAQADKWISDWQNWEARAKTYVGDHMSPILDCAGERLRDWSGERRTHQWAARSDAGAVRGCERRAATIRPV